MHSEDNTDLGVAKLLDDVSIEVCGNPFEDIGTLMKSDGAAIGVSRVLEIEDDKGCDTHDGDKIGCAAIGRLARSRNKVIVNPFNDC